MRFKGCTFARKIMLLDHFSVRFPDEDACVAYFREICCLYSMRQDNPQVDKGQERIPM